MKPFALVKPTCWATTDTLASRASRSTEALILARVRHSETVSPVSARKARRRLVGLV